MTEPSKSDVEPVGETPVGQSGTTVTPAQTTEPTKTGEEPVTTEESKTEIDTEPEVDFEDLKSVPKPMQKIAKQMQASYTKKMQALASVEKTRDDMYENIEPPTPEVISDEKQKVMDYMNTPEGGALKGVIDSIVSDRIGDMPEKLQEIEIGKQIEQAISRFGEKTIEESYPAIEMMAKRYPNVPLEMVVSNVLYEKAKDMGAQEYKSKITKKSNFSETPSGSSANVTQSKAPKTLDEAFENASSKLGY